MFRQSENYKSVDVSPSSFLFFSSPATNSSVYILFSPTCWERTRVSFWLAPHSCLLPCTYNTSGNAVYACMHIHIELLLLLYWCACVTNTQRACSHAHTHYDFVRVMSTSLARSSAITGTIPRQLRWSPHKSARARTHTHTQPHTHTHTHTRARTHTHTQTNKHTHTHSDTQTHTHTLALQTYCKNFAVTN